MAGVSIHNIYLLGKYTTGKIPCKCFERLTTTRCHTNCPTVGKQQTCHFMPHTGRGSYNNSPPHTTPTISFRCLQPCRSNHSAIPSFTFTVT